MLLSIQFLRIQLDMNNATAQEKFRLFSQFSSSNWFQQSHLPTVIMQAHISFFSPQPVTRQHGSKTRKLTAKISQATEIFPLGKKGILVTAVNESHRKKLAVLLMKFPRACSVVIKQTLPLYFHWRTADVKFFNDQ